MTDLSSWFVKAYTHPMITDARRLDAGGISQKWETDAPVDGPDDMKCTSLPTSGGNNSNLVKNRTSAPHHSWESPTTQRLKPDRATKPSKRSAEAGSLASHKKRRVEENIKQKQLDSGDLDEAEPATLLPASREPTLSHEQHIRKVLQALGVNDLQPGSWEDLFLQLFKPTVHNNGCKEQLKDFSIRCKEETRGKSLVHMDDFLTQPAGEEWDTHDKEIDSEWASLVNDVVKLSEGVVNHKKMSKPSGPLNAVLACVWHYPTYATDKADWGHTMDRTNPSIAVQYTKFGPSPFVRSQDRIPFREQYGRNGVSWDTIYPHWEKILSRCDQFSRWLNGHSKIIMLIGEDNAKAFLDAVQLDDSLEQVKVRLRLKDFTMFTEVVGVPHRPFIIVVREKETKRIRRLVLFSYHTQYFMYTHNEAVGAYHDLLWNTACVMAGVEIQHPTNFLAMVEKNKQGKSNTSFSKNGPVQLVVYMRNQEKQSGKLWSEGEVRSRFRATLERHPEICLSRDAETGSWILPLLLHWCRKGNETQERNRAVNPKEKKVKKTNGIWVEPDVDLQSLLTFEPTLYKSLPTDSHRCQERDRVLNSKLQALFKTLQVRRRLSTDPTLLRDKMMKDTQKALKDLGTKDRKYTGVWLSRHVVWYAKDIPNGLRYVGDGGPESDDFPYDQKDHPAVKLESRWMSRDDFLKAHGTEDGTESK